MMGRLKNWITRSLVNCCIICLFLFIQSTCAQLVFLSIQCCSDANFTEPITNITWITDENWYPDNRDCEDIARPSQDYTDYNRSRVFSSDIGNKWCYNLTTKRDQDYLVRGTFLSGDLQRRPPGSVFNISIDATVIGQVNSSDESTIEVEGIFKATKNYVNFCLLKGQGVPYISKLELRPLTSDYLKRKPSSVLKVIDRVDAGNEGGDIRYKLDQYDRIWRADRYSDPMAKRMPSSTVNDTSSTPNITFPPTEVLQTALTHPERLEFFYNTLDTEYHSYDLFLYFLELNESVQAGQRVFDVYINDVKRSQVDVVLSGSPSFAIVLNVTAKGYLNLTMVKTSNGSQLGPSINAFEILQVHPLIQETVEEVDVIMDVKNELLGNNLDNEVLMSWSGDPCLPISWPGLFCEPANGTFVITKMNLSFSNLGGPVSPSITKLIHLKEVDISHNNLMGDITAFLTSLPNLTTLYFGCNPHLSNGHQASLKRSNLTTDNGICTGRAPKHSTRGIVIGMVAGGCFLVTIAIGVLLICRNKGKTIFKRKLDANEYPMTKSKYINHQNAFSAGYGPCVNKLSDYRHSS